MISKDVLELFTCKTVKTITQTETLNTDFFYSHYILNRGRSTFGYFASAERRGADSEPLRRSDHAGRGQGLLARVRG